MLLCGDDGSQNSMDNYTGLVYDEIRHHIEAQKAN